MHLSLPTICQESEKPLLSLLVHFLSIFFTPLVLLFIFALCPIRLLQLSNKIHYHHAELSLFLNSCECTSRANARDAYHFVHFYLSAFPFFFLFLFFLSFPPPPPLHQPSLPFSCSLLRFEQYFCPLPQSTLARVLRDLPMTIWLLCELCLWLSWIPIISNHCVMLFPSITFFFLHLFLSFFQQFVPFSLFFLLLSAGDVYSGTVYT